MALDTQNKGRQRTVMAYAVDMSKLSPHLQKSSGSSNEETPTKHKLHLQHLDSWWLTVVDREVLTNALACAGASMADPLMSLVDTAFVGRLGLVQLAALGPNAALYNVIFFLFFTALAVICTQAMASANSRGDAEGVGRGFVQALAATTPVSLILVLLLVMAPEQVLGLFQTNAEMMPYAKTYCVIRALCIPAALCIVVCQAAFRSLLDLRTPFLVVMAASTANLVFDQLFMFNAGWGIAGCGWASVVSQYMGAGLFACIIYHKRHQFGIPAALNAAAERYCQRLPKYNESKQGSYSQYPQDHQQQQQISLTGIEQQQQQPYQQQQQQQLGQLQHPPPSHHHLPLLSPLLSGDLHDSVEGRGNRPSVSGVRSLSSWSKFVILIASLDWHGFSNRFLALTTRGVLILSTYTSASVVAARSGTSTIAGHQVVQQQQQLQMSVAWSFLHVGQSMVANVFHSTEGPKAARKLAQRIIFWGAFLSINLAILTFGFRRQLPRFFTHDQGVLTIVHSAVLPAALMLGLSWNNALEGCLLGADDSAYVVKVYPWAVVCCLTQLALTTFYVGQLTGVWWGLAIYYLVLLLGFAGRFWGWRAKI
eukprot:jgi/Chrzof1/5961/Cz16g21310.t1